MAIYQGPKVVVWDLAGTPPPTVALVQGRDALVRVFYAAEPIKANGLARARLEIEGAEAHEYDMTLFEQSGEPSLESTANFVIPGSSINEAGFSFTASILEETSSEVADNPEAIFPAKDTKHTIPADGARNVFRVMMVPYQYNADGSGRLPEVVANPDIYRNTLKAMYPVSDVEMVVREPIPWSSPIGPDGSGWQAVGQNLFSVRASEKPSDDWYYYAIFSPSSSAALFCSQGCLLGVTLLNDTPPDVGNPSLRIGLGVGFPGFGANTAAHELGHSHGRGHANCGGPQGVDFQYPHAGASIGTWGWDIVTQELKDPGIYTDIMGYCDPQFVSDYTFNALLNRGAAVNLPREHGPLPQLQEIPYEIVSLDGSGNADFGQTVSITVPEHPGSIDVLVKGDNAEANVKGHYYHWDHMPGGWLMYPKPAFEVRQMDALVEGAKIVAQRL